MSAAKRVTFQQGRKKRSYVLDADSMMGMKVGDDAHVKGDPEPWTLIKIEDTEILLTLERRFNKLVVKPETK